MLNKFKKWLGIEGVKLELDLPERAFIRIGAIAGKIRFFSKHEQTVQYIKLTMIERYSRGRGKERLVDEYILGSHILDEPFTVPADEVIEIKFSLPFEKLNAPIDDFANKNFLTGGLAKLAKTFSQVKSEYRIEAEAKVEGTALNPFDKKDIMLQY